MSSSYNPSVHIQLRLKGNKQKKDLFHWIAGTLDRDYPMAPEDCRHWTRKGSPPTICPHCHGMEWRLPRMDTMELRRLAYQIATYTQMAGWLKVRIQSYIREVDCQRKGGLYK